MIKKKITAVIVITVFVLSLTACTSTPLKTKIPEKPGHEKGAQQLKAEREEEKRGLFIEGLTAFSGLVIGGLIGLLISDKGKEVTNSMWGGLIGGGLGFGLGMVIFSNTKPGEVKADDRKIKEYFDEYKYLQLKDEY